MRFQTLINLCLVASASLAAADSLPANNYLWGEDRMGKMVRRAVKATSTTKTTSTAKTTSSVKTSATSVTSSTSSSIKASSTASSVLPSSSAVVVSSSSVIVSSSSSKTSATSSTSSLVADAACTNGALTRSCWSGGYSIATDFDQKHPTTGKTVTYNLDITETTCSPDGNGQQQCLLINNQYPGPVLRASWGDMLSITVTNSMTSNGTSMHWHGIRQLNSVGSDGVNGVTECPLAPGQSKTYTFQATQFGTSWYHSHYSSQYGTGIVGTMIIDGPASANYDVDLGTYPVTDWYYAGAIAVNDEFGADLAAGNPGPAGDNILINGTNKNSAGGGSYSQVTVTPGKKHRLRLINTSVDNFIRVKLDNHPFTVMTADFIPVVALPGQDWVLLAIGQRYDVIFTANQTAGNYWFRAEVATDCLSANNFAGQAIFTYSGQTVANPTTTTSTDGSNGCSELTTVPYWKQAVDSTTFTSQVKTLDTGVGRGVTANGQNLVLWHLNTTAMAVHWDHPTLQYLMEGNTSYPASYDLIEIPAEGVWTYWIIQIAANMPPPPHPIHLHGHDFFVLGRGSGIFANDVTTNTAALNFANPPRRDTATLPGGGWLALAFQANNPGAWLMHCHIAWHISEGLGVQFLEAKNSIVMPDATQFNAQCAAWKTYAATMQFPEVDSGL